MKLIRDGQLNMERLQAVYRGATRGLPNDADRRLTLDELLALAAGSGLGSRQADALRAIAESAEQATALRLLNDTQALAMELAIDLRDLRRPTLVEQLRSWWQSAGMPPVVASAGIVLMAVIGFQFLGSAPSPLPQTAQAPATAPFEMPMFDGAFEASDQLFAASLEPSEQPDQVFGGDFDS